MIDAHVGFFVFLNSLMKGIPGLGCNFGQCIFHFKGWLLKIGKQFRNSTSAGISIVGNSNFISDSESR